MLRRDRSDMREVVERAVSCFDDDLAALRGLEHDLVLVVRACGGASARPRPSRSRRTSPGGRRCSSTTWSRSSDRQYLGLALLDLLGLERHLHADPSAVALLGRRLGRDGRRGGSRQGSRRSGQRRSRGFRQRPGSRRLALRRSSSDGRIPSPHAAPEAVRGWPCASTAAGHGDPRHRSPGCRRGRTRPRHIEDEGGVAVRSGWPPRQLMAWCFRFAGLHGDGAHRRPRVRTPARWSDGRERPHMYAVLTFN